MRAVVGSTGKTSLGGTRGLGLEPHSHWWGGSLSSFIQYYKYKPVQQYVELNTRITISFRSYISPINNPYQLNFVFFDAIIIHEPILI